MVNVSLAVFGYCSQAAAATVVICLDSNVSYVLCIPFLISLFLIQSTLTVIRVRVLVHIPCIHEQGHAHTVKRVVGRCTSSAIASLKTRQGSRVSAGVVMI